MTADGAVLAVFVVLWTLAALLAAATVFAVVTIALTWRNQP